MENIDVRVLKNDETDTDMLKLKIAGWDLAFHFKKDSYDVIQTLEIEGKASATGRFQSRWQFGDVRFDLQ